jgi:tRNA(Arg) A34 adenosine deaminase TadA
VRPGDVIADRADRTRLAIRRAAVNVARQTGGPFGAAVFERDTGRVISAEVNIVVPTGCSLAHAEAMALALAQRAGGTHDLAAAGLAPTE